MTDLDLSAAKRAAFSSMTFEVALISSPAKALRSGDSIWLTAIDVDRYVDNMIDAAAPLIEAQVRAQVAREIETAAGDNLWPAMFAAARIARGVL